MATMTNSLNEDRYIVVHPLDDEPEEKVNTESLGPMVMTSAVKWSLVSLRGYLVLMLLLVTFHVLQLAGLFGAH
jgi:hypothetical protein